jgi:hypothetical protein
MTVVSPVRTTALPWAWERDEVDMRGRRDCEGARPFVRVEGMEGSEGLRLARRKGCGESLAKVARGKVREAMVVEGLTGLFSQKVELLW